MKKLFHTLCASALVAAAALATTVQAAELHVMSSGGFTAAYKLLGPQFERTPATRSTPRSARRWASRPRRFRTGSRAASRPTR
jgi:hypothetical protein